MRQHLRPVRDDSAVSRRIAASICALVLVVMVACEGLQPAAPPPPPPPPPAPQPVQPTPAPQAAPVEEKKPVYAYNPGGRRDPFMPLIVREEKKAKKEDLPPLQRYAISEFKLTGIMWGGYGYNAMLEAPDGKGYFIKEGTIVGPNRGVVKKITKYGLVIEERFKTYTGEQQRKEIVVELRKKREGL